MPFSSPLPVLTFEPIGFATCPISNIKLTDLPREPHEDDFAVGGLVHFPKKIIPPAPFVPAFMDMEFDVVPDLPTKVLKRDSDLSKAEPIITEDPRPAVANRWHIGMGTQHHDAKPVKGRVV